MAGTILLIRHGETAWNREKVFRGIHDVPLNDNGRTQAVLAARALAERRIDAAYTSPLSRARETAEIVLAPHGVPAIVHSGLIDFNYGDWTGVADAAVAAKWPREHAVWNTTPHLAQPPGGDTLARVSARAEHALKEIVSRHADATVAVFAHRVINKLLVLMMLGLPLERFKFIRQDNCCVDEFAVAREGFTVFRINDTSHLRSGGADVLSADF